MRLPDAVQRETVHRRSVTFATSGLAGNRFGQFDFAGAAILVGT